MKYTPYNDDSLNIIYNLLFCDDIDLFKNNDANLDEIWRVLLADKPDEKNLVKIAHNNRIETRQRIIAFKRLQRLYNKNEPKELLGTIIEVAIDNGLDTLAVYVDHRVRYINATEKLLVLEPAPIIINEKIQSVLSVSQKIIEVIGPWNKERLAPPEKGSIRFSFLVSDGLYFGQGEIETMTKDQMGSAIFSTSSILLKAIVEYSITNKK